MPSAQNRVGIVGSAFSALMLLVGGQPALARDKHAPSTPPEGSLTPRSGPSGPAAALRMSLVWFDVNGLVPGGFEPMAREVETVFAEIGVHVDWREGGPGTTYGEGETTEFPVILLPADPSAARASTHTMGLVMSQPTPPYPIWLFLSNVLWALGERTPTLVGNTEPLARALGRVVAHEVVHAVTPEQPHAREGIMRHALDRLALLGPRTILDAACARNFREALCVRSVSARASTAGVATALGDR